jgi:hypothetical protein
MQDTGGLQVDRPRQSLPTMRHFSRLFVALFLAVPLQLAPSRAALPVAADTAIPTAPTLFVLGDSTARNIGKGKNGEPVAGWGTPLENYFDPAKITVANVAHAVNRAAPITISRVTGRERESAITRAPA